MIFLHFIKEKDSHFFSILPGILRIKTLFGVVVTNDNGGDLNDTESCCPSHLMFDLQLLVQLFEPSLEDCSGIFLQFAGIFRLFALSPLPAMLFLISSLLG
jgi:hypothetical protein